MKLFWLTLAAAAFVVTGHAVAANNPTPANWGWHHYGYLPSAWSLIGLSLAAVIVVLAGLKPAFLNRFRLPPAATILVVMVLGGVLFWVGRERTFFLGDGQLLINSVLIGSLSWYTHSLSLVGHQFLNRLVGSPYPAVTFAAVSVACGMAYLGLSVWFARHVARTSSGRVLVFGILASAGLMRLFFGHVETYPLLAIFVTVYCVLGVRYFEGKGKLWPLIVVATVAVPVHVTALALFPSLLYLGIRGPGDKRRGARVLATLAPIAILLAGMFWRWPNPAHWAEVYVPFVDKLHPLGGSLNSHQAYTLFSGGHLGDFFQEQMILGPFATLFLLLALVTGAFVVRARALTFLLWAGLPWWVFSFFYSREIGAARDWDLFAVAAIPLLLAVAWAIARHPWWEDAPGRARVATAVLVGAGVFHTVPWVALGAHHDSSLGHFVSLFSEGSRASRFARSYGFETLSSFYFDRGDFANAEVAMSEAYRHDPDNLRLGANLGSMRLSVGKVEEAIVVLEETARRNSEDEFTQFQLANAYMEAGRYGNARTAFEKVIALNEGFFEAYLNLARMERMVGDRSSAERWLLKAKEQFPESGEVLTNLGLVYQADNRPDAAIDAYREGLALHPDDHGAAFNLGRLLMEREELDEAIGVFEKLVARVPGDFEAWINLGVARNKGERNAEAIEAFDRAMEIDANRGEPYFNMAQVHLQDGDREAAIGVLRAFTARDSTSAYGMTAKSMIRRLQSGQ